MKRYPTRVDTFDLRQWGQVQFRQWLFNDYGVHFHEDSVTALARTVAPGTLAVDVGAYTGDTALPMALATGKTGKVVAFEPGPASFPLLVDNMHVLNNFLHVDTVPFAVTAQAGVYDFHYCDEGYINGGFSTHIEAGIQGTGNKVPWKVKGVSLSIFLQTYYEDWLPKWSYLKIDTEGYDKDLLFANASIIGKYKPVIEVEVYPFLSAKERDSLKEAIRYVGYKWAVDDSIFNSSYPVEVLCLPNSS